MGGHGGSLSQGGAGADALLRMHLNTGQCGGRRADEGQEKARPEALEGSRAGCAGSVDTPRKQSGFSLNGVRSLSEGCEKTETISLISRNQ